MHAIWIFPFIGAIIGYLTNYLAVKMIFRPRNKTLGVQGLIPRRRQDLARSIGQTVSEHLIHKEDILKALPLETLKKEFEVHVGHKVDSFINNRFIAENPMIGAFMSDSLKEKIKAGVVEEMSDLLPTLEDSILKHAENNLDTKNIVIEKIENFDVIQLETIVLSIASKELKAIEILGGVLGALVGFIQYLLINQGFIVLP